MKHIRHLIILQKKNDEGGSVETVSSAVITALYNMSKDELLVYNSSDLKGDLHCAVGSSKLINSLMAQYPGLNIEADTYTIDFDDAEFERICVANWGSDGVVTASALSSVVTLGSLWNVFKDNTNIIKATDFIYFTGLTRDYMFSMGGCTNLIEATIPPHVTTLTNLFLNCSSLTTINGLNHINEALYSPFAGCESLTLLVFTSLTGTCNLGEMTNSALTNVEINEGCTEFKLILRNGGPTTFNVPSTVRTFTFTCKTLTTITFAANSQCTATHPYGGFSGCTNLTTINNFPWDTWTNMESYCFASCESLTGTIKTPRGLTNIPSCAINRMKRIDTIIIDSAVTSFGTVNFDYISSNCKVIMNPTTPPTLSSHPTGEWYSGGLGCVFYVPDASYNDYISSGEYWTLLYNKGRIKKMSELPS